VQILGSEPHGENIKEKTRHVPRITQKMRKVRKYGVGTETHFYSGDENVDGDFVIFVKIQQIWLDALLHISILLLLKKIGLWDSVGGRISNLVLNKK
jgi:hypothetical protein